MNIRELENAPVIPRLDGLERDVPAPLRRDVRLLGSLLGKVLVESGGPTLLEDVEALRRATIALRDQPTEAHRRDVTALVQSYAPERAKAVTRAFTAYFQLINLAEERHRVRVLRDRARSQERVASSLAEAVQTLRAEDGLPALTELLSRLELRPVLTAHPTEARRRSVVEGLQRIAAQLERLDGSRLSPQAEAEVERRLLEEITTLWRTAQLRAHRPTPLDEVRATLAVFDETLFRVVPVVYRNLDRALAGDEAGRVAPSFPPFLRLGSWVGGDRDGNPNITAQVTRQALALQADHVLRGLENAARRIARALTVSDASTPPSRALLDSLENDATDFAQWLRVQGDRTSEEPHRRKLELIAERLLFTRTRAQGAYPRPEALIADLRLVQTSLVEAGAARLGYGELQHLIWQAQTFGFHLASLEVRQHSGVHEKVLEELLPGCANDVAALERIATSGWPSTVAAPTSELAREVLATFRTIADCQAAYGAEACRRYVISFTRSVANMVAVRALARYAVPDGTLELEVVPLFESRADLQAGPGILEEYLRLPSTGQALERSGRRLEVMLGYSDSTKDVGFLAANLALYRAQEELAAFAARHRLRLTVFHGRGGALGRGGGPTNRAVRSGPPGSVQGRFKVTEQGEVIQARYGNPEIAERHLEQVTHAVLLASRPSPAPAVAEGAAELISRMAKASEKAYRDLVQEPGFAEFFTQVTPVEELAGLQIGSRPSRRGGGKDLESLRAISWVFAWSQSRINLPGWFGLGTGLAAVADTPAGLERLRKLHAEWSFFASLLDNAEMSLAKADLTIAELYLALSDRPELTDTIVREHRLTLRWVAEVTGHAHPLDGRPILRSAVALRNPYVDALSFLQLRFLSQLRGEGPASQQAAEGMLLSINGVAAGLQNTG